MARNLFQEYLDAAAALPAVAQEEAGKAQQRAVARKQEAAVYGDEPGVSIPERAVASIPISARRKLGFLQKKFGAENVQLTESGEIAIVGPDGKTRLADPHMTMRELVLAATAPVALPAIAAAEAAIPGSTGKWGKAAKELVGDVADVAGDIGEGLVQAAVEGGPGKAKGLAAAARTASRAGVGGTAGAVARWGASQLVPSDQPEISLPEVAQRGATNAAISVPAQGAAALAGGVRAPWSKADPSALEVKAGKVLFGEAKGPVVAEGRRIESAMGTTLTPDALTKNPKAFATTDMLRDSPGLADEWANQGLAGQVAASRFINRRADAGLAMRLPAKDIGEQVGGDLVRYYGKLDAERKAAFSSGMADLLDRPVPGPIVPNMKGFSRRTEAVRSVPIPSTNQARVRDELMRQGFAMGDVPSHQSLPELQKQLSDYGTRSWGGGRAAMDRTQDQYVAARMKEAVLDDIEAGLPKDVVQDFKTVRANYAKMSKPLETADSPTLRHILGLNEKMAFERIPSALLQADAAPLAAAMAVAKKANPRSYALLQRGAFEAALSDAAATGKSLEGSRLKDIAKQTGEPMYTAGAAAKGLRENRDKLAIIMGGGSPMTGELDMIIEGLERMDLATRGAKNSKTARMLMSNELLASLSNVVLHPVKTATEAGTLFYKRRITRLITNPRQRDLFLGITHAPPDVPQRVIASNIMKLGAMIARDEKAEAAMETDE